MNANTIKTAVLLAGLGGILMVACQLLAPASGGLYIGLALGLLLAGGSYWFSDRLAIRAARAVPVTETQQPGLYAIVRGLAAAADMPMPGLYVSPSPQPNAFATGRNPEHAAVCVTQGILLLLDADELRGVLAHELSHVRNRDILIGSVAAAIAMGITALARMAMWGSTFGGRGRRNSGLVGMVGLLAGMVLAPLAATLLQLAVTRSREFQADASGAELVDDGEPLARALAKIDAAAHQIPMPIDPAHASAYIVNPLTGQQVAFANLFRTHPPTAQRIARLRGRGQHAVHQPPGQRRLSQPMPCPKERS